ncbi:MAG: carbohydrate-binding family 9-like protein [Candidatus Cloacimonadota bacterium]|nr:MAG: carbohydrate-binding family 9-like protein [Candidatus Cloacimonadota bacterium]PIE77535.1 MAG: carbohydrate-binding family 9-like protein [Candidatus Delongbacteria bacterium]
MKKYCLFVMVIIFSLYSFPKPGIAYNPKKYISYKLETPIICDGNITDSEWKDVEWSSYFVDIEGDLKPKPRLKTRVKMGFDKNYFYFAAEMEEPHIWGTLTERDAVIYFDNDIEIFIDPDGDTHNYYELEINSLGTEWDLFITTPYRDKFCHAIDSWDIAGIKTGVSLDGTINDNSDIDKKWCVEVAIPWKVLEEAAPHGGMPKDKEQWKVNFSRVQWELDKVGKGYKKSVDENGKTLPENNWVWSPQGIIAMHYPEMWGIVQFSHNSPKNKVEFIPNPEDSIRYFLREIYYFQREYYEKNNTYAKNLSEQLKILGKNHKLTTDITTLGDHYYIMCTNLLTNKRWYLRSDGKIWSEEKK